MRQGMKFLTAVAAVLAMAWIVYPTESGASCVGSDPLGQAGLLGIAGNGGILTVTHGLISGWWIEPGFGDPADDPLGSGSAASNDGGATNGFTPLIDAVWIDRTVSPRGLPGIRYDWASGGVNGCLSGGPGTGVTAFFLLDSSSDYAVVAVGAVPLPVPSHNYDLLFTGVGPNGNDVPLVTLGYAPVVLSSTITDPVTVDLDIDRAIAGVNYFTSDPADPFGLGLAPVDPAGFLLPSATGLVAMPLGGGTPTSIPCDPFTGCTVTGHPRDVVLCWDGPVDFVGAIVPGGGTCAVATSGGNPIACTSDAECGFCSLLPALSCVPGAGGDAFCASITFGVCAQDTCVLNPPTGVSMGAPTIPAACTTIAGPTVNDQVFNTNAAHVGRFTEFTWTALQSASVSGFDIVDITGRGGKGNRVIQHQDRLGADLELVDYRVLVSQGQIKGAKLFALDRIHTDGTSVRFEINGN